MADKKSGNLIVPPSGGMLRGLINQIKLVVRLLGDRRVNLFIKLLPLASLAYFIWPIDALFGPLDDAAIIWIGSTLFVELCPPDVVREIRAELESNLEDDGGEIVDADVTDVNDK